MISRAQCSQLVAPPLVSLVAHRVRIRPGNAPGCLRMRQVLRLAHPLRHRPAGAVRERLRLILAGEPHLAVRADPGRDLGKEQVHQLFEPRQDLGFRKVRPEEAHAAVDVVPHPSRRDHARFGIGRHDGPDGQAIALVDIGHRIGGPDDAREHRRVGRLFQRQVVADLLHELVVGEDDGRDAHPRLGLRRDPPAILVEAFDGQRHVGSPPILPSARHLRVGLHFLTVSSVSESRTLVKRVSRILGRDLHHTPGVAPRADPRLSA